MFFAIATWLRLQTIRATNWLVMTAFGLDRLSEILLTAAKRWCRRWYRVQTVTMNTKGQIIKFGVKKHGIRL